MVESSDLIMENKHNFAESGPGVLSSDSSATIELERKGPPNGGLKSWAQVLGAFFLYFNTWGIVSSFGSYQSYYEDTLLKEASSFQVSSIGSVQSFLMVFLGFIAGPVFDQGHFSHLLRTGSVLILIGTMSVPFFCYSSSSVMFWSVPKLINLGSVASICMGLGMGLLAVPSVAVPSAWFTSKLPLANGIVVSASGFGGVVYPIMIRSLIPIIGFKHTSLSVALVILVTLGVSNAVLHQPTTPQTKRAFFDQSALTDVPYILFVVGCMLAFLGLYTTFFYLASYAVQEGITTESTALYFVSILNGASVFGRVLPNIPCLTLRLGPLNMMVASVASMATIVLSFNAGPDLTSLLVMIILYGFFTGAFFTLQPTIFARLTDDPGRIGTRTGMASTICSVGLLLGSPSAGVLWRTYGFPASLAWSGCTLGFSALVMAVSRCMISRWKLLSSV